MGSSTSQIELIERLGNTVKELHQLLDLYAPQWYSDELRQKTTDTLLVLKSAIASSSKLGPNVKAVRSKGHGRS